MNPSIWGPSFWKVLHAASFYAERSAFVRLVDALRVLLPCPHCRSSYGDFCRKFPPQDTSYTQQHWAWLLHDRVNVKLGKDKLPYSKLAARQAAFCASVTEDDAWSIVFVCLLSAMKDTAMPTQRLEEASSRLGPALSDCLSPLACSFPFAFPHPFPACQQSGPAAFPSLLSTFSHAVLSRSEADALRGLPRLTEAAVRERYDVRATPATTGAVRPDPSHTVPRIVPAFRRPLPPGRGGVAPMQSGLTLGFAPSAPAQGRLDRGVGRVGGAGQGFVRL